MSENTTPIAPVALVPKEATKYVSAKLYSADTSMIAIDGNANEHTNFGIGVFDIFSRRAARPASGGTAIFRFPPPEFQTPIARFLRSQV